MYYMKNKIYCFLSNVQYGCDWVGWVIETLRHEETISQPFVRIMRILRAVADE
jgi:hypothetical protein